MRKDANTRIATLFHSPMQHVRKQTVAYLVVFSIKQRSLLSATLGQWVWSLLCDVGVWVPTSPHFEKNLTMSKCPAANQAVSQALLSNWEEKLSSDCRNCLDLSLLPSNSIFFFFFLSPSLFFFFSPLLDVKIENWTDSAASGCSYDFGFEPVSISSLKLDGRILLRVSWMPLF